MHRILLYGYEPDLLTSAHCEVIESAAVGPDALAATLHSKGGTDPRMILIAEVPRGWRGMVTKLKGYSRERRYNTPAQELLELAEEVFMTGWRAAHGLLRFQDAALHHADPDTSGFRIDLDPRSGTAHLPGLEPPADGIICCTAHDPRNELAELAEYLCIFGENAASVFYSFLGAFAWAGYALAWEHSTDLRLVRH